MRRIPLALLAWLVAYSAWAEPLSFHGKTVTVIVPYGAGGGTDLAGRLIAEYLARLLPGGPSVITRNMPGADGMAGMNYFVQKTPPDGLTLVLGSGTTSDPLQYRKPQSHYDPTRFNFIGGVGRGGSFLLINKAAEPRLYDKRAAAVTMGSVGGVPRAAMEGTVWGIEFLGWNARWVVGYHGTNSLILALERGEIDMTATGVSAQVQRLLDSGKIKILTNYSSGSVVRTDFGDPPVFASMLQGKIKDATAKKAFDYYLGMMSIDKWVALHPATREAVVTAYRAAFAKMSKDPEFLSRGRLMSEEFEPMTHTEVARLVDTLGNTPPDAIRFIDTLYKKQGLLSE
jgi:tripartite-type tricarboxylate transporter receptor subunit TctC